MRVQKILMLSLLGMMVSQHVFARDEIACPTGTASGSTCWKCGDNCTATLTGGKMTISGTGDMDDYTSEYTGGAWVPDIPWADRRSEITSLTVESGITHLGARALHTATNLTSVELPEGLKTIGLGTFYKASGLENVTIPSSVTSLDVEAFNQAGLKTVTFADNSQLKNMYANAFSNTALRSINIPDSVETIGDGAFWNCTSLTNIHLPASLTSLGDKVFEYANLETLEFPEGITYIPDRTCAYCYNLKKVVVKGDNIDIYYNAFHYSGVNNVESSEEVKNILLNYFSSQLGRNVTWTEYFESVIEDYVAKRIYTVQEATEALGSHGKNTFSIRYR